MAVNVSNVFPINWTRLLKDNPKLTINHVDAFSKLNKAPQRGIVKGYKFFCEGFLKDYQGKSFISPCLHLWAGGVLLEKLGGGVRPASQNPYPIYDQDLQYSLPYLWPD